MLDIENVILYFPEAIKRDGRIKKLSETIGIKKGFLKDHTIYFMRQNHGLEYDMLVEAEISDRSILENTDPNHPMSEHDTFGEIVLPRKNGLEGELRSALDPLDKLIELSTAGWHSGKLVYRREVDYHGKELDESIFPVRVRVYDDEFSNPNRPHSKRPEILRPFRHTYRFANSISRLWRKKSNLKPEERRLLNLASQVKKEINSYSQDPQFCIEEEHLSDALRKTWQFHKRYQAHGKFLGHRSFTESITHLLNS